MNTETRILLGYNQFLCAEELASGGQFSLSLFEDLNKLIEAVVLYDKVVVLGDYNLPSGLLATPLQREGILDEITNNDVRELISNDVAKQRFRASMLDIFGQGAIDAEDAQPERLLDLRISPNRFDSQAYNNLFLQTINCGLTDQFQRDKFTRWITENIFETRKEGGHFYYMARSVLYSTIAESCEIDYAPDLLRIPIAALSFSRETKALPKAVYDALVSKVNSEVEALMLLGMPVSVFIPPLTAKILSNADDPKNYPNELLQLRNKFSGFRKTYGEFLSALKNPKITLREKIDAKNLMLTRITGIIDTGESRHALNVKTIWDKLVSSSLGESEVTTKLSLSGVVSLLLEQLGPLRQNSCRLKF